MREPITLFTNDPGAKPRHRCVVYPSHGGGAISRQLIAAAIP